MALHSAVRVAVCAPLLLANHLFQMARLCSDHLQLFTLSLKLHLQSTFHCLAADDVRHLNQICM